uniref:General negative regulator of transcription subunit 4 n=1 Tax=Lygus hesperus TaxID=30085 RepID=A0A0A9Z750_LYGHE
MDATDLAFHPCRCNYTTCIWCFSEINRVSKRCPGCRIPYDVDKIHVDPNELKQKEMLLQSIKRNQQQHRSAQQHGGKDRGASSVTEDAVGDTVDAATTLPGHNTNTTRQQHGRKGGTNQP